MSDAAYLALAYLRFHPARTAVLVVAIALIALAPLGTRLLLKASEERLTARAETTPLLIGARGSALDLTMNALYFTTDRPEPVTMTASEAIWQAGLADAYPVHVAFKAGGAPIVGVTVDYFAFRGLDVVAGRSLAILGEAVLGAAAARSLGLGPGDALISSPETLFDLAGAYPLKMSVVGVLAPTGGPDDRAVFVDLKTAWVIQGLGHGHDDVAAGAAPGSVMARTGDNLVAGAALREFTEITAENVDSFHFHGDPDGYPITAVIAAPYDERSAALLRGRYLDPDQAEQIVVPAEVIRGLLDEVFRIRRVLDAIVLVVAVAAGLALALAGFLSVRLREREIETVFKLGCRPMTVTRLIVAEIAIVLILGATLAAVVLAAVVPFAADAALWLLNARS